MNSEGQVVGRARRPTIADVARLAETSRGTVSFVINDRPGVSPATRKRVLDAMETLSWTPNQLARSLSTRRAYAIGLILARDPRALSSDPFFAPFIAGLETGIEPSGQFLVLRFARDHASETAAYRSLTEQHRVDGFVLSDLLHDDERVALLESLQVPAVTLNRTNQPSPFPAVVHADEPGVVAAVEHLVAHGHRRIAHVGGPARYLHAARRRAAWEQTTRDHGLEAGPFVEADFTAAGGLAATKQLLDLSPAARPTAILYANDLMAASGVAYAQQQGVRVPSDLSVIGFDDAELSGFMDPPLTSVRTDPFAWGVAAAELLLEVIDNRRVESRSITPGTLVVRRSVGPAATAG